VVWLSFPDPADALKFFNLCLPLVGPDWSMRAVEWSSKIEMNTDARFPVIQHAAVLEHLRGLPTPAPATDGDLEQETRWIEENICGTCGHNKGVHTGGKCEAPNCLCRTSQPEHVSDMRLVEYASGEPCEAHAEGTRCGQCDLIFIARELIVIRTTPPENTLRPYVRHLNGCAAGRTHACTCGHPDNNHFDFDSQPCAHCSCKAFTVGACSCGLATALVAQKEVV
jgi:hypothetical protein